MTATQSKTENRTKKQSVKLQQNQISDREKFQKAKKALYEYWKD